MTTLADLTTLRLGGPPQRLEHATTEDELVELVRSADAWEEPVLLVGGGSNLVVADAGWPGVAIEVGVLGISQVGEGVLEVGAGEAWDALVAHTVEAGLAGMECLAGIPGSVGATPIQNVGAYGQEVAQTIASVRAYDRRSGEVEELGPDECAFGYRSSAFKRDPDRRVVLAVTFALDADSEGASRPIGYAELARTLGVSVGASAPVGDVRAAVLGLRRGKGMVLDPRDPDTRSAGSFFTNPVLSPDELARLEARVDQHVGGADGARLPRFPQPDGSFKTSAAWLVERAGFPRGYGLPGPVSISTKHTLALTNRGGASAAQLVALAREVADGVQRVFGVRLEPEPVFAGHVW